MSHLLLQQGSLAPALVERSKRALACGAMQPIATTEEIVQGAGVDFLVRRVSSLERKEEAKNEQAANPTNPFLPHDPDLFVADVSDTHFALLNKFNVIEHHLLIVTRAFVHQETLLDAADFEALAACMAEVDGLAFYNGGAVAGASQPHKHLQLVPLPLGRIGPPLPVDVLFEATQLRAGVARVPGLPFEHSFHRLDCTAFGDVAAAAGLMHARYLELLAGLKALWTDGHSRQSGPYNLLATRRWMLLVPRRKERFASISVNALGYAGSLFVRDRAQLDLLKRAGPMAVLRKTAIATP
jgi:sulfate adenylyltransferase (ADP) / ATP adenylyltransferase